jgi:hypothetical protein
MCFDVIPYEILWEMLLFDVNMQRETTNRRTIDIEMDVGDHKKWDLANLISSMMIILWLVMISDILSLG